MFQLCILSCHEVCILAAIAGLTSPNGRCHTFDAKADGYARSEGVSAITLRRLRDGAEEGASSRMALSIGSAVRADGKSASLTAPNGAAQRNLYMSALRAAGTQPNLIMDAEAHGTGTALGDPIETGGLSAVFLSTPATEVRAYA